mgnify:CR=1
MANHASAKKRNRQNIKIRAHNRTQRSAVRTIIKKTRSAIEEGNSELANQLIRQAEKAIAKASSKGLYHKANAARKISRLAKQVNAL